jgi:hypothetical protein
MAGESQSSGAGDKAPKPPSGDKLPAPPSTTNLKKSELRRHVRFVPERATATLYQKKFLTTIGIGRDKEARHIVNLSESGALIILASKLASGTKVQVRIEMEQYNDVIETEGEIRWCYQSARNKEEFYAGIQFHNLPKLAATRISKMRDWFTSPEYKLKSSTRRRMAPLEQTPKDPFEYEG